MRSTNKSKDEQKQMAAFDQDWMAGLAAMVGQATTVPGGGRNSFSRKPEGGYGGG
jgi:hypothetical protein